MRIRNIAEILLFALLIVAATAQAQDRPNVLVIWGDDVGQGNISAYSFGLAGYRTPNVDRIASEGMLFTDYYGGRTATAGRAAYLTGQNVYRTGLSDAGPPGKGPGVHKHDPTIADLLGEYGYMSAYFGQHPVGDRDVHLPTNHGFNEFLGSLYDTSAKEPAGKRGVIRAFANGRILDTGPLSEARVAALDDETIRAAMAFIERANDEGKPFYVWWNASGTSSAVNRILEHDGHVGQLLAKLDDLGISDNTLVHYSTDSGTATSPFDIGNKLSEGHWRVPSIVRWPGRIKAGSVSNEIMHHLDWLPTLLAIAGATDIKSRLEKDGVRAAGRRYQVHLDGYDFTAVLESDTLEGPRREVLYFADTGELVAMRFLDWKGTFAASADELTMLEAPVVDNLRLNPYGHSEVAPDLRELTEPAEGYLGQFLATFADFPPRAASPGFGVEEIVIMLESANRAD